MEVVFEDWEELCGIPVVSVGELNIISEARFLVQSRMGKSIQLPTESSWQLDAPCSKEQVDGGSR